MARLKGLKFARRRYFARPAHDVIEQLILRNIVLGRSGAAAQETPALWTVSREPRNRVVPGIKVLAFVDEAIGAGGRQPFDLAHPLGGQLDAIRHLGLAAGVVGTTAGVCLEQPADDIGEMNLAGVLVLQFDEGSSGRSRRTGLPIPPGSGPPAPFSKTVWLPRARVLQRRQACGTGFVPFWGMDRACASARPSSRELGSVVYREPIILRDRIGIPARV